MSGNYLGIPERETSVEPVKGKGKGTTQAGADLKKMERALPAPKEDAAIAGSERRKEVSGDKRRAD